MPLRYTRYCIATFILLASYTMNTQQFKELLQRYREGRCTDEEKNLVDAWYIHRRNTPYPLPAEEEAQAGERMYRKIARELGHDTPATGGSLRRFYRGYWMAAAILVAVFTAGYFLVQKTSTGVATTGNNPDAPPAIVPGGNKALLTLADGSVIVLDSAANDTLSIQGKTLVFKQQDGQLVYRATASEEPTAIAWNTISTPRGGQYQVVLPDGSRVWLNAASSLRFPASFSGDERRVELTGEAYFEIESYALPTAGGKKKKIPFKVTITQPGVTETSEVEVLGTHFNIMAYADEATINTTLLEGAIKMHSGTQAQTLKPGQQAQIAKNGHMHIEDDADTEEAIAWKNGLFQFYNADIQTVMRQIARWYDVEVEYAGPIPSDKFEGEIPRNSHITEVLNMLELSNVHCKIEGKKLIIL